MVRLPPSPDAPPYEWEPWGSIGRRSNNCYAYGVNAFQFYRPQKSTPGEETKLTDFKLPSYETKAGLTKRILMDNPGRVYKCSASAKPKPGFFKMMMFIAREGNEFRDFHFYRQHNEVNYKVKKGETAEKIARFFQVPVARVKACEPLRTGKIIRFEANGWSHKQGWGTGPLLVDASGNVILDPRKANRDYGELNYKQYGGSFCVKNCGVQVGKTYA